MKLFRVITVMAATAAVLAAGLATMSHGQSWKSSTPQLSDVQGTVFVRERGRYLWERAEEGIAVESGNCVRTGQGSSVLILFSEDNFVKVLPLSKVTVGDYTSADGIASKIIQVNYGRAFFNLETAEEKEQFVIKSRSLVSRGKSAAAFVEADDSYTGCIDVVSGSVIGLSEDQPDVQVVILPRQRLAVTGGEQVGEPVTLDEVASEDGLQNWTCLPESARKNEGEGVQAAEAEAGGGGEAASGGSSAATGVVRGVEGEQGEQVAVIAVSTTVQVQTEEQEEAEETETGGETGSAGTSATAEEDAPLMESASIEILKTEDISEWDQQIAIEEAKQEIEYTELLVTSQSNVTFGEESDVPAETTQTTVSCDADPEIFEVYVSDMEVDDSGEALLDSDYPCDLQATASVQWTAFQSCGSIKSMTFRIDNTPPKYFGGGDFREAVNGFYEFRVSDNKPKKITIRVEGSNGKHASYLFDIKLQGQALDVLPEVTDIMINGVSAEEDASVMVGSRECARMNVEISGKAESQCGDIKSVTVEADGRELAVRGRDFWSAATTFEDEDVYMFNVYVEDMTGRKLEDFQFELELYRDIAPPSVEIESLGGKAVSPFGAEMALYRNDLESGKLVMKGNAGGGDCPLDKVEVSIDGASTWVEADGTSSWEYRFRPSDGNYEIEARAQDEVGNMSDEMMNPVELLYSTYTLEEKLQMVFDDMMQAYKNKDADTFMEFTSPTFTADSPSIADYSRLDLALNDKFDEQTTIYIRYRTSSSIVSGNTGRVNFKWDADSSSAGYSHTGTFVYLNQTEGWQLATVEDSCSFLRHTDEAARILDMEASSDTLEADKQDTATITLEVRDCAYNPVKDGTTVYFTATSGTIPTSAATEEGQAEVTYTSGSTPTTATITATTGSISDTVSIVLTEDAPPGPPGE